MLADFNEADYMINDYSLTLLEEFISIISSNLRTSECVSIIEKHSLKIYTYVLQIVIIELIDKTRYCNSTVTK